MANLSEYYPAPIVPGQEPGTYAAGDDPRIVGAASKIGSEDIEISDPSKGLILHCEDGSRWRMTIGCDGTPYFSLLS